MEIKILLQHQDISIGVEHRSQCDGHAPKRCRHGGVNTELAQFVQGTDLYHIKRVLHIPCMLQIIPIYLYLREFNMDLICLKWGWLYCTIFRKLKLENRSFEG